MTKTPDFSVRSVAWHARKSKEVLTLLGTATTGLSQSEANKRLTQYGLNKVKRTKHFAALKIFARQFQDLLIILLLASVVISFYLEDAQTTIVLATIIVINLVIGFTQEYKADRIMHALQQLLTPVARVVRAGKLVEVDAELLVPGDLVHLEAGDNVPADIRLIQVDQMSTNDYTLTGESSPSTCITEEVAEKVPIADRSNMAYMGTVVAAGVGTGVVVATGMRTELGTIAKLSQESSSGMSPLQKEIGFVAKRITQGTLILIAILVPISLNASLGVKASFAFAIGIAAAMIPQGLAAEVNVALSQAASKMAKARALVKRLPAVETLGATQIICTDKTGTLTKNEMTITNFFTMGGVYDVEQIGFAPQGIIIDPKGHTMSVDDLAPLRQFLECGLLANNASIHEPDDEHLTWYSIGDPTEAALVTLAYKSRLFSDKDKDSAKRLHEFPFDSDRKRMSVVVQSNKQQFVYCKGAPESILEKCDYVWTGNKKVRLNETDKKRINDYVTTMSSQAMRNLALAYKPVDSASIDTASAEQKLVFLGVVSMIDPPREQVAEAMAAAELAHMKVTIVTGDEARTAAAIAQRIGFGDGGQPILITNQQLSKMSDRTVLSNINTGRAIFSRVSPTDKLRIVNLLKKAGNIIAVTGDGVNDAPALKRADIGVAMGRVGSDVAKESAEIVLLDDSFHTLIGAIQQGRVIFQNIRKATLSCLTSNAGELVVVLISLAAASLLHVPIAITVIQILAIDLMAELFPIAALGWDPPTSNIMSEKPRNIKDHILNLRAILDLLGGGIVIGGLAYLNFLVVFAIAHKPVSTSDPLLYAQATTVAYLTIVICQYVTVLSRRTAHGESMFSKYLFSNWHLWGAIGLSFGCVLAITYVPTLAKFIGNGPVTLMQWLPVLVASVIYLCLRELFKVRWRLTAS